MSFRNLFQKDIDNNRTPSSFSFNQTKSKIADQQQQKPRFEVDHNITNNTFNNNEDNNSIFYAFDNNEIENENDEYKHDSDNNINTDNDDYCDNIEEEEEGEVHVKVEEEENIENAGDTLTSVLADNERRRRNIEASIRFRVRKKNKIIQLENQINSENSKIEKFKINLHRLEIENACLRKMLLGNWNPKNDNISDNNFSNDSNLLSSAISNSKSNFEILQLLKQTEKHL